MPTFTKPRRTAPVRPESAWPLRLDQQRLAALIPPQGTWTADDYLWLVRAGAQRVELADGWIEELPMPSERHQRLLGFLYRLLHAWLAPSGGIVVFSPLSMRVAERRFREPDLLALRDAADRRRGADFWAGADLVVEVVSPSSAAHDLVTKRREYAEAGVAEYWIVDGGAERVVVLALEGDGYREHGTFERDAQATSPLLPGLSVDVGALFDEGAWGAVDEALERFTDDAFAERVQPDQPERGAGER